jgi:hypothetical protein
MPLFRGLFNHNRPGTEAQRQDESIPALPPIKPMPAGRFGLSVFPDRSAGIQPAPGKFGPAIVIGLGKTGEIVLRQWIEKMAQNPAGPQSGLRAILISNQLTPVFPDHSLRTRLLTLDPLPSTTLDVRKSPQYNPRAEASLRFKQVSNYKPFRDWLGESLLDLHGDVQVFIVGSLAEAMIGVIGGVLQILRAYPESQGRGNPYLNVIALLSLTAADPKVIPPAEIYAAQREIGRFTFTGPHCTDFTYGLDTIIHSALLDHFFLIENYCRTQPNRLAGTPFNLGIGQAFSELLLTLLHPSARPLWQSLADELRQKAGQVRDATHDVLVNSFGIATLDLPVEEIQSYIAARLAKAAIYGERAGVPEGLINQRTVGLDTSSDAQLLARRWLLQGQYYHPFFEWLLNISGPSSFGARTLSIPSGNLVTLFQAQIAYGLVNFLNDPAVSDLGVACQALELFNDHLGQVDKWFRSARLQNQDASERLIFQALLNSWRETILHFIAKIKDWQKALASQPEAETELPSSSSASSQADWRTRFQPANPVTTSAQPVTGERSANLFSSLQNALRSAEEALNARAKGRICRPVTAESPSGELDSIDGVGEVKNFYTDTIRPELSRFIRESNPNFTHVRERLEWWVNLAPDHQPELILLCWPVSFQGAAGAEPPSEACFTPETVNKLGQTLLDISRAQILGRADDLTGTWFKARVSKMADFLHRANDAFLQYDQETVASQPNAASRRSFLIAKDPSFSQEYLSDIFQDIPRLETRSVGEGEKTRFTALTFRLNIPVASISAFITCKSAYEKSFEPLHIYAQESTAKIYEKRIRTLDQDPDEEKNPTQLPPELTLLLADSCLTTIFAQALFAGLISIVVDEELQKQFWVVDPVDEQFSALTLAPVGEKGLWNSFRKFVLELPNAPEVNLNPSNHFYNLRREDYLARLTAAIKTRMQRPDYIPRREQFKKTILADLQRQGRRDLLARSFACILSVELDEPVWKDW